MEAIRKGRTTTAVSSLARPELLAAGFWLAVFRVVVGCLKSPGLYSQRASDLFAFFVGVISSDSRIFLLAI
jgi:hypothetical protein